MAVGSSGVGGGRGVEGYGAVIKRVLKKRLAVVVVVVLVVVVTWCIVELIRCTCVEGYNSDQGTTL